MKEELRLATKAQAQAVRDYLQTLGVELSHTQALKVIARGQGLRSRQNLAGHLDQLAQQSKQRSTQPTAAAAVASGSARYCTRVAYRYVDGGNCKRFGQMVFRGRIRPEQLKFIQSRLDDGLYFVPAQVGFENLAFCFTDFGGEDHGWHTLELGEPDSWTLDAQGYVLTAGDVEQVVGSSAGEYATDADCDNLMFRFARLKGWDEAAQLAMLGEPSWAPPETDVDDTRAPAAESVAHLWRQVPTTQRCTQTALEQLYLFLQGEGFEPRSDVRDMLEWTRPAGPNAYQFVILQACDPEVGDLVLNYDVSTHAGDYVTETPVLAYGSGDVQAIQKALFALREQLNAQRRQAYVDPAAWSAEFE